MRRWSLPLMTSLISHFYRRCRTRLGRLSTGPDMRNGTRYTPSDVFETFPRPHLTERMRAARRNARCATAVTSCYAVSLGSTALYNLVN